MLLQDLMLLKQSQVLTNLASLDEEEAGRAESASLRWQVRRLISLQYCESCTAVQCGYMFQLTLSLYAGPKLGPCSHHTVLMLK